MLVLVLLALPLRAATAQEDGLEPRSRTSLPIAAGESLAVTISGDGTPVVLLPGLFGSAYGYRRLTAILDTMGYRSTIIEPLGIGSSSRPPSADYSLTAQADRIAAALDTLGLGRAVFVAHSVGASIAMRVAYRHPKLVRGIVSLEGGPTEAATTKNFRRLIKIVPIAQRAFDTRRFMLGLIYSEMKKVSADDSWVDATVVQGYTEGLTIDYDATLSAYQGMAKAVEPESIIENLAAIPCPVVLLIGDFKHGSRPPREEISTLASHLRAFSVDTVSGSGFFIQEEQPSAVATAVEEMARGPGCGDGE